MSGPVTVSEGGFWAIVLAGGEGARLRPLVRQACGDDRPKQYAPLRDRVRITVADTGCGIPPDFLPHVFEPFRQAESGITRPHDGLGPGLAIVHRLVKLHGGSVSAASPGSGKGATFTVELPTTGSPRPTASARTA